MDSGRKPVKSYLAVPAIRGLLLLLERVYERHMERIEWLCYNASLLGRSLDDALEDNEIENADQILDSVIDSSDGRTIRSIGRSINDGCYEIGFD